MKTTPPKLDDNPHHWIAKAEDMLREIIAEHGDDRDRPEPVICLSRLEGCVEWLKIADRHIEDAEAELDPLVEQLGASLDRIERIFDEIHPLQLPRVCPAASDGLHATTVIPLEQVRPELGPGVLVDYCSLCTSYELAR